MTDPGAVEQAVGGPPLKLRTGYGVTFADVTSDKIVGPVVIRQGRVTPDTRPDPALLTATILRSALAWVPEQNDLLTATLTTQAKTYFDPGSTALIENRFNGVITDVRQIAATVTMPALVALVAVSRRARLAEYRIDHTYVGGGGATPFGDEQTDGEHVAGAVAAAGRPGEVLAAGGSTVVIEDTTENLLAYLDNLAAATGGEVVDVRGTGGLWWRTATYPATVAPTVVLTAANVVNSPMVWTKTRAALVNDVQVPYGREPDYAEGVYSVADTAASARYGPGQIDLPSGVFPDAVRARARAEELVSRRGRSTWAGDALTVDLLRTVTAAQARSLLAAEYGTRGSLAGLPADAPYPTLDFVVQGWTETLTRDSWTFVANVSEDFTADPTWNDVPVGVTWNTPPTDVSWLGSRTWVPTL